VTPTTKVNPVPKATTVIAPGTQPVLIQQTPLPTPLTVVPTNVVTTSTVQSVGKGPAVQVAVTQPTPIITGQHIPVGLSVSVTAAPTPSVDHTMVAMLSKLADKVDALTTSHQTVMTDSGPMRQQLVDQLAQMKAQQLEIDRLRAPAPMPTMASVSSRGIDNLSLPGAGVSVPGQPGGQQKKFYAVARGRQVGVFTQWKDAERSVHGYSGAIHKRFRSKRAALQWLNERRGSGRPDDASEISYDGTQVSPLFTIYNHTIF
jgi:hypothetical protein